MLTASIPSRAAFSAAMLIRLARSAPLKPGVPLAMTCTGPLFLSEQAVTQQLMRPLLQIRLCMSVLATVLAASEAL